LCPASIMPSRMISKIPSYLSRKMRQSGPTIYATTQSTLRAYLEHKGKRTTHRIDPVALHANAQ
jgi:hypothetical protein